MYKAAGSDAPIRDSVTVVVDDALNNIEGYCSHALSCAVLKYLSRGSSATGKEGSLVEDGRLVATPSVGKR